MEKGMRELLIDELHDMLSAEAQMIASLPKLVIAAESSDPFVLTVPHFPPTLNSSLP